MSDSDENRVNKGQSEIHHALKDTQGNVNLKHITNSVIVKIVNNIMSLGCNNKE